MTDTVNIALGQIRVIPGRPDINVDTMLNMISEARESGADIIVFPEMALSGVMLGDTWEQESFLRDCEEYGNQIIKAATDICVVFGNVAVDWNRAKAGDRVPRYNALFVAYKGRLHGGEDFSYPFRIMNMENSDFFYSLDDFAKERGKVPGEISRPVMVNIDGRQIKIACYIDSEVLAYQSDSDLMVKISSRPFYIGAGVKDQDSFSEIAKEKNIPLVHVNAVGSQNNGKAVLIFPGYSKIYNNMGKIIGCCQEYQPSLSMTRLNLTNSGTELPVKLEKEDNETAFLYKAVINGIKEFLRSIEMERVVIGVSGGIDSALSAALYSKVLGPDNVLLVNMPSIYNSATTRNLSARLARNLGCLYTEVPIQDSVEYTVKQVSNAKIVRLRDNFEFELKVSAFMQENIQARDRSSRLLAAFAAAYRGGFTCNANKSEITVGYSTFYGDQAGFFAALADLWKNQVYALAEYLNKYIYKDWVIPEEIFGLVPSAELSAEQAVDQGKGDPLVYPYHDYLFKAFTEDSPRLTPEDILGFYCKGNLEEIIGCETGLVNRIFKNPSDFIADLERWWQAYTGISIAKRIQSPPLLILREKSFGYNLWEAQNSPYFSLGYKFLKEKILSERNNK
ncbi:MAG: NAD(+) synthase [Peptococcaceae bacterium]|nr:NAD(+) synthase [Peptococcaceae bacterium]